MPKSKHNIRKHTMTELIKYFVQHNPYLFTITLFITYLTMVFIAYMLYCTIVYVCDTIKQYKNIQVVFESISISAKSDMEAGERG